MTRILKEIVLASGSPYRAQLLQSSGLAFRQVTAPIDEKAISARHPEALAIARAEAKAHAVAHLEPDLLVIGCDQVLALGEVAYDKAHDREEARRHLIELSGKTHRLLSAYCLFASGPSPKLLTSRIIPVVMPMRALTPRDIDAYLATDEWRGSVGGYKIEGRGIALFDAPPGDASTIIGLPLVELLRDLRALGIDSLVQPSGPWSLHSL